MARDRVRDRAAGFLHQRNPGNATGHGEPVAFGHFVRRQELGHGLSYLTLAEHGRARPREMTGKTGANRAFQAAPGNNHVAYNLDKPRTEARRRGSGIVRKHFKIQ